MAAPPRARPIPRPAECPCELIGGTAASEVTFDQVPAHVVADPGDRALVLNVAMVALHIHVGKIDAMEWHVEVEDEQSLYNVVVKYPLRTGFTWEQLGLVKKVNSLRVKEVWAQSEADCAYLCASVWRSDAVPVVTRQDVVILRTLVDEAAGDDDAAAGATRGRPVRKRARPG